MNYVKITDTQAVIIDALFKFARFWAGVPFGKQLHYVEYYTRTVPAVFNSPKVHVIHLRGGPLLTRPPLPNGIWVRL